jgi:hypothetical protein
MMSCVAAAERKKTSKKGVEPVRLPVVAEEEPQCGAIAEQFREEDGARGQEDAIESRTMFAVVIQ